MITQFIEEINSGLRDLVDAFPGARVYGLAQSVFRKMGSTDVYMPCTVTLEGEGTYIGIDDTAPLIMYHKTNSISSSIALKNAVGNGRGDQVNNYQNTLIIYSDQKKTKLLPDEILLYVQANYPEELRIAPYKQITVRFTNVILNTQVVFQSEYKGVEYKLPAHATLLAINYTIESIHKRGCFDKCPEVHSTIKNI